MEAGDKIKKLIEEKAAKHLEDIERTIDRTIESAVLSLIGLEKNGHRGGYEIDHCNSRNSVLIDAFRNRAIDQASKLAKQLKLDADEMKTYRSAFRREYSSAIHKEIRRAAEEKAKADANELVRKVKINIESCLKDF